MQDRLFLGTHNEVAAVEKATGRILWRTTLRQEFFKAGYSFVTLLVEDGVVYAHTYGRLYAVDGMTGQVLWENLLEGMGHGMASLAVEGLPAVAPAQVAEIEEQERRRRSSN